MAETWKPIAVVSVAAVVLAAWYRLNRAYGITDEWAEDVVAGWAEGHDPEITAVELDAWSSMASPNSFRFYRVRVRDREGLERGCRAAVGRWFLRPADRNIRITRDKPR